MPGLRLGVFASGRGTDLQSILDAQKAKRIQSQVVVVIADKADAGSIERARKLGVAAEALVPDAKLPKERRARDQEERIVKVLDHFRVDLVVLAGYMRLLSPTFVRRYPNKIVNIHPALLPAFPGLHGQRQAIEWGARIAGCTTHFVDEHTDHGPILLQAAVGIAPDEAEEALSKRILEVEHQLLPRTIHLIEQGRVRVEGRRALLDPDASWREKYPVLPGVLYGPGY